MKFNIKSSAILIALLLMAVMIMIIALPAMGSVKYEKGFAIGTGGFTSASDLTGAGPRHYATVPLGLTANATVNTGVFVAHRAMTIKKVSVAFVVKPASSAGTITLALTNYDLSATTDDNLINAATFDLEGLTAKTTTDLTLTATAADLVLADGDFVYAAIVSNNADAVGGGGVLTLEYTLQ